MRTVDIPHDGFLQYDMKIFTVLIGPPQNGDVGIFGCRQKNILSRNAVTSVGDKANSGLFYIRAIHFVTW
jgi:hypothetical protein